MRIHLFRHGIAIDRDDPGCPDEASRYLTDKGTRRTRDAARGLAAIGVSPGAVLTSPFVRARQTAEIAVAELGVDADQLRETAALLPGAAVEELRDVLAAPGMPGISDAKELLCVGHAPGLDELIAWLVGAEHTVTRLTKAGLATVELRTLTRGTGDLIALYPASTLRRLGAE
jgi:phosphohistidine phosphatase